MAPSATEKVDHLLEGRAEMESMMLDTCRVTRPGVGSRVFDEDTLQYTDPARVVVYEGKCRFQVNVDVNSNVVETTAGDHEWTYLTSTLQTPIEPDSTAIGHPGDIRPDNVAEILTCPTDAAMVGRLLNLQGQIAKSDATHRKFRAREVID